MSRTDDYFQALETNRRQIKELEAQPKLDAAHRKLLKKLKARVEELEKKGSP